MKELDRKTIKRSGDFEKQFGLYASEPLEPSQYRGVSDTTKYDVNYLARNSATTGSYTVSHSLGKSPKFVRCDMIYANGSARSFGAWSSSNEYCLGEDTSSNAGIWGPNTLYRYTLSGGYSAGSISNVSTTDITIVATTSGSPTGTLYMLFTFIG